jgi:hypothetical protein
MRFGSACRVEVRFWIVSAVYCFSQLPWVLPAFRLLYLRATDAATIAFNTRFKVNRNRDPCGSLAFTSVSGSG